MPQMIRVAPHVHDAILRSMNVYDRWTSSENPGGVQNLLYMGAQVIIDPRGAQTVHAATEEIVARQNDAARRENMRYFADYQRSLRAGPIPIPETPNWREIEGHGPDSASPVMPTMRSISAYPPMTSNVEPPTMPTSLDEMAATYSRMMEVEAAERAIQAARTNESEYARRMANAFSPPEPVRFRGAEVQWDSSPMWGGGVMDPRQPPPVVHTATQQRIIDLAEQRRQQAAREYSRAFWNAVGPNDPVPVDPEPYQNPVVRGMVSAEYAEQYVPQRRQSHNRPVPERRTYREIPGMIVLESQTVAIQKAKAA